MEHLQSSPKDRPTILLVENDLSVKKLFSDIFEKEGWNLAVCEDGLDVIQWLNDHDSADLLIIEENASPINGYQIADYIKTELALALPVIITTEEISVVQEARTLAYAEAVLKRPLTAQAIVSQIKSTLTKAVEAAPVKNDYYSLNYLMDLSDGDQQFVKETIALFSTTINLEIRNLKEVLENKDFGRIREIAHGIKPSFEMMENETGRGICNLLNTNATEMEMPKLIEDLSSEFRNINSQLIKDFPELKLA